MNITDQISCFACLDAPRSTKSQPESFGHLNKDDAAVFNVQVHSGKQLRHFKYATVNLLVSLFSNTDFTTQVSCFYCGGLTYEKGV